MSSPTTRRDDRQPKSRSTRKRSTSSTFASLIASLTPFSSSNNGEAATPASNEIAPLSRRSNPQTTPPQDRRKDQDVSYRRSSKSNHASPREGDLRITSRPANISKALTRPTNAKSQSEQIVPKPDVFSFMLSEVSTPPTPRPQGGSPKELGLGIFTERPTQRSYASGNIASPTPQKPLIMPKVRASVGSYPESKCSDSDVESDADDSSGTPTPTNKQVLAAKRSLERLKGQNTTGKSTRSSGRHRKSGRKKKALPEAPMPPSTKSQNQLKQVQRSGSYDLQHSSYFQHSGSPGMLANGINFQVPYPTPPEDVYSRPGLGSSHSMPAVTDMLKSSNELALGSNPKSGGADALPRQYRILTQSTIKRTEAIIDDLEAELHNVDGSIQHWEREQLVMRLSNTLIMHHRLVDIWSKISQLDRLSVSRVEDREKIEAVWQQLRQQYSHHSQVNGVGVDNFISGVVNDLVNVGERAQITAKEDSEKPRIEAQDLRVILIFMGLIVVFLLLRDETFQAFTIAAGVALGIYTLLQNSPFKGSKE